MTLTKIAGTALMACLIVAGTAAAKSKKKTKAAAPDFSYYLLSLSYAPDFCAQAGSNQTPGECGKGLHKGFVVHGLWPQGETSRGPENCKPVSPVSAAVIQATLPYIPTKSLIQHEWTTHGSCSGLDPADFFALVRKAFDSVKLPDNINHPPAQVQMSPADIESSLAAANSGFAAGAFRVSCYPSNQLQEVRVCFTKDLTARACTASAGECAAPAVTILPNR